MRLYKISKMMLSLCAFLCISNIFAAGPLWTFTPLTPTKLSLINTKAAIIRYTITNQSPKTHTLALKAIPGVIQVPLGPKTCGTSFTLGYGQSCNLILFINARNLTGNIINGPAVCDQGNPLQCYQPSQAASLNITLQPAQTNTVGGFISGLIGSVTLQNNGSDNLAISTDGNFTFPTSIPPGSPYNVTVLTQPAGQTCTVNNASGTMGANSVRNVRVTCATNAYTISGNTSGLTGTVVLQNNGTDNLIQNANGAFSFSTPLAQGSTYNVTVLTQPTGQTCSVGNSTGTVGNANITNIVVTCSNLAYNVSGTLTGLTAGTVSLLNNGTDSLTLSANGTFTFPKPVANGAIYRVTIQTQPATQFCTVSNATGIISGSNVTNVSVNCTTATTSLFVDSQSTAIPVTPGATLSANILVSNVGPNTATNVHIVLPSGWNEVTQDASACTSLAPQASCAIILTATAPYAPQSFITVTGDNVSTPGTIRGLAFSINNYLVFNVESPTNATVIDTALSSTGIQWGQTGLLVGASSTENGQANTTLIVGTPGIGANAAAVCYNSTSGGAVVGTWYLPAICQLGTSSDNSYNCTNFSNVNGLFQANFQNIPGINSYLWSSTEVAADPSDFAFTGLFFESPFGGSQDFLDSQTPKMTGELVSVLCVRSMPY